MAMKQKRFLFFGIALLIVILDQLTKFLITSKLTFTESIPVIKNFFHLTLIKNFGIGFGLINMPAVRWILVTVTIIIIFAILYYYKKIPKNYLPVISTSLILGGAIGNLIDRILFGFVIDFIDFKFWPAFNIADSAITIGVIGLIVYFWRDKK
jgi:signal peptidase II